MKQPDMEDKARFPTFMAAKNHGAISRFFPRVEQTSKSMSPFQMRCLAKSYSEQGGTIQTNTHNGGMTKRCINDLYVNSLIAFFPMILSNARVKIACPSTSQAD